MHTKQQLRLIAPLLAATLFTQALAAAEAELGMDAPPLTIAEWIKGEPVTIAKGKGDSIYVVEFWATWCPPCRASVPHLSELQKTFKDKNVVIIGISDETAAKVKPFVKQMGEKMDYVVAVDEDRKTYAAYMGAFEVKGIPHAFVVNKEGKIVWHGHPMAGLDSTLEQIIAGKFDIEAAKKSAAAEQELNRYFNMAAEGKEGPELKALGNQILTDASGNAELLNNMAWVILTHPAIKTRDLDLAVRAAKLGYDATDGKNPNVADTYARALFDTGKKAKAIQIQEEAVKMVEDEEQRKELQERLKEYKSSK